MAKTIGQILKQGRTLCNMTLRQVEEATNISNAYISQLENDKIKSPSYFIIHFLCDLYNIDKSKFDRQLDLKTKKAVKRTIYSIRNLTFEEKEKLENYLVLLRTKQK